MLGCTAHASKLKEAQFIDYHQTHHALSYQLSTISRNEYTKSSRGLRSEATYPRDGFAVQNLSRSYYTMRYV